MTPDRWARIDQLLDEALERPAAERPTFLCEVCGADDDLRREVESLLDAYQKRDQVGLVAFRGRQAELLLPPTNSADLAERRLRDLPTGGRTPLAHGLELGWQTIERHVRGDRALTPLLVLVSDGRRNVALADGDPMTDAKTVSLEIRRRGCASVVVDTSAAFTFDFWPSLNSGEA